MRLRFAQKNTVNYKYFIRISQRHSKVSTSVSHVSQSFVILVTYLLSYLFETGIYLCFSTYLLLYNNNSRRLYTTCTKYSSISIDTISLLIFITYVLFYKLFIIEKNFSCFGSFFLFFFLALNLRGRMMYGDAMLITSALDSITALFYR